MKKNGFSLIELLVCIVVISVLAAILYASTAKSRERAYGVACTNNMRQISVSIQMYISDHDDNFPSLDAWEHWNESKYFKNLTCPSVSNSSKQTNTQSIRGIPGYAYNAYLGGKEINDKNVSVKESEINFPSTTALLCEEEVQIPFSTGPSDHSGPGDNDVYFSRHSNGSNFAFVDGHVKWYRPDLAWGNDVPGNTGTNPSFFLGSK